MKNIRRALLLILVMGLLALAGPVRAQDGNVPARPEDLTVIDTGVVTEILKSDMVMLDNAKRYKLENILVPPFEDAQATDELKRQFIGRNVTVYTYHDKADGMDRYNVPLAHIVTDKNVWVQEDLVAKGLAWAFSSPTSPQMVNILKLAEEKARARKAGFWKDPAYAIKTPEFVKSFTDSYQIVQGRIVSVTVKSTTGTVFFNFGKNWRNDFAVRIKGDNEFLALVKDPKRVEKARFRTLDKNSDPNEWKGRVVRVRGWVASAGHGAPVMDVTHKEQIDFMDGE